MAKTQTKPAEAPVTKTIDALGILKNLDDEALTERINELERELEALRVLQKAAHIQKHGKPETKARKPKQTGSPVGSSTATTDEKVLAFLQHSGPAPVPVAKIAQGVGMTPPPVYSALSRLAGKVERTDEGYRLKR